MFGLWCNLPFEMRKMIIDRMDSKTRCMFAGVSFDCFQDICWSLNCIKRIRINSTHNGYVIVFYYNKKSYFSIEISEIDEKPTLKYSLLTGSDKFCWSKRQNRDFEIAVIDFFQTLFFGCRKSLKKLEIYVEDFPTSYLNIQIFENLQKIHLKTDKAVDFLDSGFVKSEQILSAAKYSVVLSNTKLTIEQMIQIPKLYIDQMDLTEQDVLEYCIFLKSLRTREKSFWKRRYLRINLKDQKNPLQLSITEKIKDIFGNDPMERTYNEVHQLLVHNVTRTYQINFKVNRFIEIYHRTFGVYVNREY